MQRGNFKTALLGCHKQIFRMLLCIEGLRACCVRSWLHRHVYLFGLLLNRCELELCLNWLLGAWLIDFDIVGLLCFVYFWLPKVVGLTR